jgi:hypothetical protein
VRSKRVQVATSGSGGWTASNGISNLLTLTTNWFECLDIRLANGANTITLYATDQAGNVSTNNYSYTLDYSGVINPPALTLYWPQDGARVSGTNFTLRGLLDDPTATVTARLVDTNEATSQVDGLVERNGLLWVESLPLGPRTNTLTLSMTNAAGLSSSTSLTVIQSDVAFTIDDLSTTDLNQPRIPVAGTIGTNGYTVWVNGVAATNLTAREDGTWSWQLDNVPVSNGGTAAPVITLAWPQDNMKLTGNSFTLRGRLDDPTATVVAQIVSPDGTTNTVAGLVERNGLFWAEQMPLAAGTNTATVSTTDAAGNMTTTNITVVQSDIALTLNAVPADQLHRLSLNLAGTVSAVDYTVWVNGVQAAVDGSGTWSADNVPVNAGGTASFFVTAYPPGENPGAGSGGNGMNPSSPNACNLAIDADKPDRFYVVEYHDAWDHRISNYVMPRDKPQTEGSTNLWADGLGGNKSYVADFDPIPQGENHLTASWSWPADIWIPSLPSTYDSQWDNGTHTTETNEPPPTVGMERCDRQVSESPWGCVREAANRTADAAQEYFVGGKALSGNEYFVIASASATAYLNPLYSGTPFYLLSVGDPEGVDVAPTNIVLDTFGRQGSDGQAVRVLPAGATVAATTHVPDTNFFGGGAGAGKCKLVSQTLCSVPTNTARLKIGIGEQVLCSIVPPNDATWTLIGGGSLSGTNGPSTILTASLSPTNSTVVAQIGSATQALAFTVLAPSGISVSLKTNWGCGTPGTNNIGASVLYWVQILPTNVSFIHAAMRENISPAVTNTWPDGSRFYVLATNAWGLGGDCLPVVDDEIAEPLHSISKLSDGTNYHSFSYSLNYHIEYLNQNGDWVSFTPVETTTEFLSDGSCQETYQGVPGGWKGPWQ